jgi:hypothetical protein
VEAMVNDKSKLQAADSSMSAVFLFMCPKELYQSVKINIINATKVLHFLLALVIISVIILRDMLRDNITDITNLARSGKGR